ncbi:nucleoprotein [Loveridge's garter snake virus 1]|uniref:Nucleoprotein n=1 Tax=Loveridge's garter snake virus 1 TaxID=1881951 RepID=A0A077ER37_9MONO|nr:nucleoprotein [Loveridge's garter snake virus 1]AIL50412.1 nucleoprotein [Loveridge's garter snake virus 1]
MPPKRQKPPSETVSVPMDETEPEQEESHFPDLPGKFLQYPVAGKDPHPGIGRKGDIRKNAIALLSQERRAQYHQVTGSLVFLCLLISGLHQAFAFGGIPEESYLAAPFQTPDGTLRYETACFYGSGDIDRELTQLEVSSIMSHCCSLLIGIIIGSSTKIKAGAEQIRKRFKTLMASLGRPDHGETANLLQLYNPHMAIDWFNSQSWVGSFVLGLLTTDFESPGREFMDQMRLVASYAQMTTYTTIKEYLEQCMDATLTIPAVYKEIDEFLDVEEDLRRKHREMFKYLGAIRHSDAIKLAPRSFPNLASAAFYWSKKENATMTGYKASTIQPGATVKEAQLARLRRREIKRDGDMEEFDLKAAGIMARIGVTGYAEAK